MDQALMKKSAVPLIQESCYIYAATTDNSRRAYQSDIEHFLKEGGDLPTTSEVL